MKWSGQRPWSASRLLVATVVGGLAVAAAPGFGCAAAGHGNGNGNPGVDGGTASGGDSGGTVGTDSGPPGIAPPSVIGVSLFSKSCSPGQRTVDWAPLRRISRVEYNNMVRDLLGDTSKPASTFQFPAEAAMGDGVNFASNTYLYPSTTAVQDYLEAAEAVAQNAVSNTNQLNNLVLSGIASCRSAQDDTCAKDFIATWANRAYRGQLDATESSGLFDLYSTVKAQFDWTTGLQAVITAVLESPRFLYVVEFGGGSPDGKVVALSPYEVAARLALFLWRSVPDSTLMTAAANNQLSTPAQVQMQATRMLSVTDASGTDLLAQGALDDFTNQWMQLTGIQAKDYQFATSPMSEAFNTNASVLAASMYDETRLDLSQLVLVDNGSLGDLLTSPSTYINMALGKFYGGTGATRGTPVTVRDPALAGDTSFAKTSVATRPGILTTAGVMATQAHSTLPSLVLRGKLVRENVLCDPIPAPPPDVPPPPTTAPDAGSTTRDLLLSHQQKGTVCPSCHQYMDSIGVGFGHFDATGWYQPTDANGFIGNGAPSASFPAVDASGSITAMPSDPQGLQATYTDANDLTTHLGNATQVRQCFALQEMRYAIGRVETADDACSAQQIYAGFSSSQFNVQQLLLAIIGSDVFRYRSVETVGSSCQ
jgi:Protein of unknown function (DUF1592)/Protein of unknown function (DUF1588)/Protein of unknown function (DUF1595)/Protein of unknown function (DUF1585)/Protein of unknown function (DUF1587)